jgi:hypothetical protein
VEDGILKMHYDSTHTPCLYPTAPLAISKDIRITNGKQIIEGEWGYTLLDLLYHLFGNHSEEALSLTSNGLFNENGEGIFDPLSAIFQTCSLSEDFQLRDLVDFVESQEDLKAFVSCYSWCRAIDEFHTQSKEPCNSDTSLDRLEIYRAGEIHRWVERDKKRTHRVSLDLNYDFHGLGPCDEEILEHYTKSGGTPPEEQNYSVSYTPLNEIIGLPLGLNPEMEIREWVSDTRENKLHLKCQFPFKLLDILDAVYWDISFHGGPEDNKAFLEEMKGRMEEIDAGTAKTSGPFSTVEEMFQNIADTSDDDLAKENFSEWAEEMRDKKDDE